MCPCTGTLATMMDAMGASLDPLLVWIQAVSIHYCVTQVKNARKSRGYRSELRQQQAQATRQRVIEAAARLFSSDGYARTTMARIAASGGCAVGDRARPGGPRPRWMIAAAEYVAFGVSGEEEHLQPRRRPQTAWPSRIWTRRSTLSSSVVDRHTHRSTAQLAPALFGGASSDPELDRYLNDVLRRASTGRPDECLESVRRAADGFAATFRSTNSSRRPQCCAASKSICGWCTATAGASRRIGRGAGACSLRLCSLRRGIQPRPATRNPPSPLTFGAA